MISTVIRELRNKYTCNLAHAFVLYGNTFDTFLSSDSGRPEDAKTPKAMTLQELLQSLFVTKDGETVKHFICLDRAAGITFPSVAEDQMFRETLENELKALYGLTAETLYTAPLPRDPLACMDLIGLALQRGHFGLIINYAETIFPAMDSAIMDAADRTVFVQLLKWAREDVEIRKLGNPIFLIASSLSRLNPVIKEPSSRIECIGIPFPDEDERKAYLTHLKNAYDAKDKAEKIKKPLLRFEDGSDADMMGRMMAGLSRVHISDIALRARYLDADMSTEMVRSRKNEIMSQEFQEALKMGDPRFGFEAIHGYDYLKEFLRKVVINPLKSGDRLMAVKGVLLMGPGGTGKSTVCEAVAKESGMNFAQLNIGRLFDRWVGSSEERAEKALWAIRSNAPAIVFIDELDTAVSRGDGAHEVSQRIMKMLLEFMADPALLGQVVFLAATNRPDRIDFALKRTGRFDRKVPVLPPSPDELPHMFIGKLGSYGITHSIQLADITAMVSSQVGSERWDGAASMLQRYVGSDVDAIVRKAYEVSRDCGSMMLTPDHLKTALELMIPSTQDIEGMVEIALAETNDRSLIPDYYRKWQQRPSRPVPSNDEFKRAI